MATELLFFLFYYFSACNMFLKSQECTEAFISDSQNLKLLRAAVLIPSIHFSLPVSVTYNQILNQTLRLQMQEMLIGMRLDPNEDY